MQNIATGSGKLNQENRKTGKGLGSVSSFPGERVPALLIKTLTAEAKKLVAQFVAADQTLIEDFDHVGERAWQLGRKLNPLKKLVGHGNWEKWREDAFPKLGRANACRCMALDRMNPNIQKFGDLSAESLRKYRFSYVPVKDRPKLKGDRKFERPSHHGALVNECNKLMHRVDVGLYKPDMAELVRDFEPFYCWLSQQRQRLDLPPVPPPRRD